MSPQAATHWVVSAQFPLPCTHLRTGTVTGICLVVQSAGAENGPPPLTALIYGILQNISFHSASIQLPYILAPDACAPCSGSHPYRYETADSLTQSVIDRVHNIRQVGFSRACGAESRCPRRTVFRSQSFKTGFKRQGKTLFREPCPQTLSYAPGL